MFKQSSKFENLLQFQIDYILFFHSRAFAWREALRAGAFKSLHKPLATYQKSWSDNEKWMLKCNFYTQDEMSNISFSFNSFFTHTYLMYATIQYALLGKYH